MFLFIFISTYADDIPKKIVVGLKSDTVLIKDYLTLSDYYARITNKQKQFEMLQKAYSKSLKLKNAFFWQCVKV